MVDGKVSSGPTQTHDRSTDPGEGGYTTAVRLVRLRDVAASRTINGALAGGVAAALWAAQQPLDKRVFGTDYDDLAILGKAVTRGNEWCRSRTTRS